MCFSLYQEDLDKTRTSPHSFSWAMMSKNNKQKREVKRKFACPSSDVYYVINVLNFFYLLFVELIER